MQLNLFWRQNYPKRPNSQLWHIVCYSGGHSSFLVAVEVARKYGTENLILLNHDIREDREDPDIKRFKRQGSEYLRIPIVYANRGRPLHDNGHFVTSEAPPIEDQFDVCIRSQAFKPAQGTELCTSRLKTEPFRAWLDFFFPNKNCIVYYGFDSVETRRIQRRSSIMGEMGYRTDYPLAFWPRTIYSSTELGIAPPAVYGVFKHANCIGCLKAGKQHWYVVFCTRPEVWEKAKDAETEIGHSILKESYLEDLEPDFIRMQKAGIPASEQIPSGQFWKMVRQSKCQVIEDGDLKPCECFI